MKRQKAAELIKIGQINEGRHLLRQSIDVTHEIALGLIKTCQKLNIDCIVAPYEADAQLAYLNISGIADVVITEDSDLTLFGCKKIFFKMDVYGDGVLVEQDRLHLAMDMTPDDFNMDKFRYMCILSGCDYLPSLPGIGLAKAKKFITLISHCDIYKALANLGMYIKLKSVTVSEEYRNAFILAHITFKHQLVFCPLQRRQVRLNPPTANITPDQLHYAGKELDHDIALQIAYGNCDPITLKMLHNFDPDERQNRDKLDKKILRKTSKHISIWSKNYKIQGNINNMCLQSEQIQESNLGAKKKGMVLQTKQLKKNIVVRKDDPTEYQELAEKDILETYTSENCQSTELSEYHKTEFSPVRNREINVFAKQSPNNEMSPSLIYKKKSRIISRFKKTIIDDTVITKSKFFVNNDEIGNNEDKGGMDEDADMFDDSYEYNAPKRMKIEEAANVKVEVESLNLSSDITSEHINIDPKLLINEDNTIVKEKSTIKSTVSLENCDIPGNVTTLSKLNMECILENGNDEDRLTSSTFSSECDYAVTQNSIDICDHLFQCSKKESTITNTIQSTKELNLSVSKKEANRKAISTKRKKRLSSERGQQTLLNMFSFKNGHQV